MLHIRFEGIDYMVNEEEARRKGFILLPNGDVLQVHRKWWRRKLTFTRVRYVKARTTFAIAS